MKLFKEQIRNEASWEKPHRWQCYVRVYRIFFQKKNLALPLRSMANEQSSLQSTFAHTSPPICSTNSWLLGQFKVTHNYNLVVYTNWNLTYTTRQGRRVSCLAQTGFAAFGKGVQLISGSPYAETEQLSRLTSPSGVLATSGWSVIAWI